jgi:hypothetical protein
MPAHDFRLAAPAATERDMSENICNVSVLAWPAGTTREGAAAILVKAIGVDPFMAKQRAAKTPPMIVARAVEPVARSIMGSLQEQRTPAFLLKDDDVRRLPTPVLAKRLEAAVGAPRPMYMVEPWRGEPAGVTMDDVYCIVRGRIGKASVGPAQVETTSRLGSGRGAYVEDFEQFEATTSRTRTSRLSDMIDLWLLDRAHSQEREGRTVYGIKRIRINCDKFSWDVLGKSKGHTDNENADKLALRLADEATSAVIELGFAQFREASAPAIGTGWSSTPVGGSRLDQSPAFEFYSAWCGLLHWHKAGRAASTPAD